MTEEKYTIPAEPVYSGDIRKLQDSDPASATTTFNPLIQRLSENTHAVKMQVESLTEEGSAPWLPTAGGIVTGPLEVRGKITLSAGGDVFDIPYNSAVGYFRGLALYGDALALGNRNNHTEPISVYGIAAPKFPNSAANKEYVDNLFNQVAPILVKVGIDGQQGINETKYVKCYQIGENTFSINLSALNRVGTIYDVKMYPPDGYAFTGLYESSGVNLFCGFNTIYYGIIPSDGSYISFTERSSFIGDINSFSIIGSFTLEVA